jgi:NAD-dependent deacetylase
MAALPDMTTPDISTGLIRSLRQAQFVTVMTGAGTSAESGVPTFRDAQTGLWAKYDPQELATPQAFRRQPALVWEWYAWRRELVGRAQPNPGHHALVELARLVPRLTLITQNVDGLHQRAGSQDVIELHGNIGRTKCFDEDRIVESWPMSDSVPPHCPHCGGMLRPDVVWFGESLPRVALESAIQAARSCNLFLSVGTSAMVQPAASLAYEALHHGAVVVEINLGPTPLTDHVHHALHGPAGHILPRLLQETFHT